VFIPSKIGLFYLNVNSNLVLFKTVEDDTNKYTGREYSSAKRQINFKTS